jgi:hypothetical protein
MEYSWEDVMLSIDVRDEAKREQKEQQDIADKQLEEQEAASMWSLGLSIVGGALLGPVGAAAGKIIGRQGADWGWFGGDYSDWETAEVSGGKFYKDEATEFKKTRDKAAKDQDKGQLLNAFTDLATMYVQAGGLEGGLGADFTTYGASGTPGEWSVFGRGEATTAIDPETIISGNRTIADKFYEAGMPVPDWSTAGGPSADYVPSLLEGWKADKNVLENVIDVSKTAGGKLQTAGGQASTVQNLINTLYPS